MKINFIIKRNKLRNIETQQQEKERKIRRKKNLKKKFSWNNGKIK